MINSDCREEGKIKIEERKERVKGEINEDWWGKGNEWKWKTKKHKNKRAKNMKIGSKTQR